MKFVRLGEQLYEVLSDWPQLPAGMKLANVTSVAGTPADEVVVLQRSWPPVIVLDRDGQFLRVGSQAHIEEIHGGSFDKTGRLWVANRSSHELVRLGLDGERELTLGTKDLPAHQAPFSHPADVAESSGGDVYVADGYGNARVHRFSADGELIRSWGGYGSGPGKFSTPHGIAVLLDGRIIVADRENHRVQVFSPEGDYETSWGPFFMPMDLFVDRSGRVFVTDQTPHLTSVAADGTLLGRCMTHGRFGAHGIWGDSEGGLYLALTPPLDSVTKLVPVPG